MAKNKQFKDTKFGAFLSKAAGVVPEVLQVGGKILTGNVGGAINDVSEMLKGAADKSDAAKQLYQEFEMHKMTFEKEMFALEFEDRKDARMNGDKHLQRIVAYFSLAGFTLFSCINIWLAYEILINELVINEFIIMTTSNMNGIFTGLIFTLKDFLFGGSSKE